MKLNEDMYAVVDEEGNVWGNPETDAIGDKQDVMFIVNSWKETKAALKSGKIKLVKVKLITV